MIKILLPTVLILVLAGFFFLNPQKNFPQQTQTKSQDQLFEAFVTTLPSKKTSVQNGFMPEPPREALDKAEKFIQAQLTSEAKIEYTFIESFQRGGGEKYSYPLTVFVGSNPFRWRIDYAVPSESFTQNFINDGKKYYRCDSETKSCTEFSSLQDSSFMAPLPLTEFLNDFLEPMQLKKLFGSATKMQETRRTIAGFPATCTRSTDEIGTVEVCLSQTNTPLFIYVDRGKTMAWYTLEAQKVDSITHDSFALPYPTQ